MSEHDSSSDFYLQHPEVRHRHNEIGTAFEEMTALAADFQIVAPYARYIPALFSTNEEADMDAIRETVHPNGYIYGLGAGSVFAAALLFRSETESMPPLPRAILSCDISGEVVLAGRTGMEIMRHSESFDEWWAMLRSRGAFIAAMQDIIAVESHPKVQEVLHGVDPNLLFRKISKLKPPAAQGYARPPLSSGVFSVPGLIREGWDVLKPLADEHNIGFALASFNDPSVLGIVAGAPGFSDSKNIVYSANLLDFASRSEYFDLESRDFIWQSFRDNMQPLNTPNNTFLVASVRSRLRLCAFEGLPETTPEDLLPSRL